MAEAAFASAVSQGRNDRVGAAVPATLRADAALTTSYVATDHCKVPSARKIGILLKLTYVAATSVEWYVEWSHDATTWYRSVNVSPSTGTNTIYANSQLYTLGGASANLCDLTEPQAGYMRVQIKKTDGAGADKAEVIAVVVA